jgi:hypothetical protein
MLGWDFYRISPWRRCGQVRDLRRAGRGRCSTRIAYGPGPVCSPDLVSGWNAPTDIRFNRFICSATTGARQAVRRLVDNTGSGWFREADRRLRDPGAAGHRYGLPDRNPSFVFLERVILYSSSRAFEIRSISGACAFHAVVCGPRGRLSACRPGLDWKFSRPCRSMDGWCSQVYRSRSIYGVYPWM